VAQLVRSRIVVDAAEGVVKVAKQWFGGGRRAVSGRDLDGAVAAGDEQHAAGLPAAEGPPGAATQRERNYYLQHLIQVAGPLAIAAGRAAPARRK
jgi:hypothetical protein